MHLKKDFCSKFCAELLENAAEIPKEILSKYSALLSVSLSRKTTFLNSKLFDIESLQCIQGNLIKGINKKTVRRQGYIEGCTLCLHSYVFFSVDKTKWFNIAVIFFF